MKKAFFFFKKTEEFISLLMTLIREGISMLLQALLTPAFLAQ